MKTTPQLTCMLFAGTALALLHGAPSFAAEAPAAQTALPEVVVTAQRRDERLQDVPIAVTVAGATALVEQRVFTVANIASLTPSIHFDATNLASSSANIQIRGIGTTGIARSFEGSVGVFVDGVYRTRSGQALTEFLDIDNLEILRGPQGTLFGKNTSAGALLLASAAPSTERVSGAYDFSYGNYDAYRIKAAVNVPVSSVLAFRVAVLETDHTGYIKDVNGGSDNRQKDDAVKVQLLYRPNDAFKIRFIGDYSRSAGNCCFGTVQIVEGPLAPLVGALTLANGRNLPSTNFNDYQASISNSTATNVKDYGGTILADWKIGPGVLHSVTGLRRYDVGQWEDADFSGADIINVYEDFHSKFFSEELSYTGELSAPFSADYVFGGYFSDEKIHIDRSGYHGTQANAFWDALLGAAGVPAAFIDAAPGEFTAARMDEQAHSYALFTHWDVKLTSRWNVILGLRWTDDLKKGGVSIDYVRDPVFDPFSEVSDIGLPFQARTSTSAVTGTFGLQYHIGPDAMAYATYNHGYKAGGIILDELAAGQAAGVVFGAPETHTNPTYAPETIDAGEGGLKIDWLDGRARTNAAVFYSSLSNLQVAQFIGLRFTVLSAPSATVYGAELEQTYKLTRELTLTAAGTYLPEADFGPSAVLGAPLSGRRFATAPKFAGQFAIDGQHHVSDDLAITGRFQVQYTTSVYTNTAADQTQGAFFLLNGNLGLTSISRGWTVEAWVLNMLDKRYVTQHFQTPVQSGSVNAYVGDPRTFGLTVRGAF